MKKIQLDRVYRHFESGLTKSSYEDDNIIICSFSGLISSDSPTASCSGYLKDRSVSLNFISALIKPDPVVEITYQSEKEVKLSLQHLKSVFLLLLGKCKLCITYSFVSCLFQCCTVWLPWCFSVKYGMGMGMGRGAMSRYRGVSL